MIIGQQHLETSNRTFNKLPRASENNGFHSPFHPAHLLLPSSLSVSYSAAQNSNSDRSQVKQMPPPADKIKKRNKSIFKDPPPFHSTGLERKSVLHQMAIKRRIFLFCPSLCCSACLPLIDECRRFAVAFCGQTIFQINDLLLLLVAVDCWTRSNWQRQLDI